MSFGIASLFYEIKNNAEINNKCSVDKEKSQGAPVIPVWLGKSLFGSAV